MQKHPSIRLLESCESAPATDEFYGDCGEAPQRGYPTVDTDAQLRELVRAAWDVVKQANAPPSMFRHGDILVRLVSHNGRGAPQLEPCSKQGLFRFLANAADWKNGSANAYPPGRLLDMMLDEPDAGIPELEFVATIPVLTPSRRIMEIPGYNPRERIYFSDAHGLAENASRSPDIATARLCLLEAIHDFPFVSEADRTHALAAMLLPFLQPALREACTPLHIIEAACCGTGKGLLADLIAIIASGERCTPTTLSSNPEENAKRIAALLTTGSRIIHLDNLPQDRTLDDAALASVLTTPRPSHRALGGNRIRYLRNDATWLLSGNNPKLSTELARRCIRIRLDSQTDRPWLRSGFRHENLLEWALDNRPQLVQACVDIIRAWLLRGCPRWTGRTLGSYEQWSMLLGGMLENAGFCAFLGNLDTLYSVVDPETREWRHLVRLWWERFADSAIKASELFELCREQELLEDLLGNGNRVSKLSRLGRALNRNMDRVFDGFKITIDNSVTRSSARYTLVSIPSKPSIPDRVDIQ